MNHLNNSGFCIPYSVRMDHAKGRGLFADAPIAKGTTVWRYVTGQFAVYDEKSLKTHLSNLRHDDAVYVLEHIHAMPEFPGYMIRVFDDGELTNHSEQPTLATRTDPGYTGTTLATCAEKVEKTLLAGYFTLVAVRDIQAGEELTLDYNQDPDDPLYYSKLCDRYGLSWDWL
jgi:SET domain-containing protein